MDSDNVAGIYAMQVAAKLTGMHPQTLRKYERAGFLSPSRHNTLRMYSDEDVTRLKIIKHLVNDVGLNLAGVGLVLKLREKLLSIKEEIKDTKSDTKLESVFSDSIETMLSMVGS